MTSHSYYDLAGGAPAMRRLAEAFYARLFADPLLVPLFGNPGGPEHAERMALWLGEALGGPAEYTRRRGGFPTLISAHQGSPFSEEQRARWVSHMLAAYDEVGLPDAMRGVFVAHMEQGSRLARGTSQSRFAR